VRRYLGSYAQPGIVDQPYEVVGSARAASGPPHAATAVDKEMVPRPPEARLSVRVVGRLAQDSPVRRRLLDRRGNDHRRGN
jgi:hypothetical protein